MSLLEEWQTQDSGQLLGEYERTTGEAGSLRDGAEDGLAMGSSHAPLDAPIFSLEIVERNVTRGRGQVTAATAANNIVTLVTSRGWLLRYDIAQGSTPVTELELLKGPESQATGVWTEPSGMHCIVAMQTQAGIETLYMHAKWKKARPLSKGLKGEHVTAVAWQPDSVTESSTGEVALGTESGKVISVVCNEKEKKERGAKTVLDLSELQEPVKGLQQLLLPNDRLLLLVSTPKRLYAFCGSRQLEALGDSYPDAAGVGNYVELPADEASGSLACYTSPGGIRPQRFAWQAGPGLYKGGLDLTLEDTQPSELDYLVQHNLLPLPLTPGLQELPIAIAQTEYHELVLYKSRLHVINSVSQGLTQEIVFTARSAAVGGGSINPLGFTGDTASGTLYLFTGDALVEVVLQDEDRDMWRVYLDRNDFANAFRRCRNQAQRDTVNNAEAVVAFSEGRLLAAAKLWGRVTGAQLSFEETALKFVEAGVPDALQAFLLTKLDTLAPGDKAQATMVATWLTELYLDRINRALLEDSEGGEGGEGGPQVKELTGELRDFLRQRVELLDVRTTMNLLASYGRLDDLMHYASYRQDHEAVLEYLVQNKEVKRALAILRRPDVSQELFYKFAPGLMALAPGETVDAWMTASPPLQPRRLLPALLRYADEGAPSAARTHAQRYVQFCMQRLQSSDPAVHQLAVALYCGQQDEVALMEYLASARGPLGNPLYDPQAALRLARQHKQQRACVELLWELGLFEDAVSLALEFDMQQAVAIANRPQEDERLQRKLWLAIACHLIQTAAEQPNGTPGESIKKINDLMREAGGLLKIEDILPLFPDFVQIDNFKDAICQSLEDYNTQIAGLKSEMDDATRIADALRKDVALLEQRTATLDLTEPCARCGRAVGEAAYAASGPTGGAIPRYFLFPTGNAFHGSCLAEEVMALAAPQQKARIMALLTALSQVNEGRSTGHASTSEPANVGEMQASLQTEITFEDPYNGELVIRHIDRPFIVSSEVDEIQSWEL